MPDDLPTYMEEIGPFIRQLRKRRGMSQRELARQAGVYSAVVSDVESGKRSCNLATAQRLLCPFGMGARLRLELIDLTGSNS